MATIFAVYNNDGCVGRCDAKCHEAKEPECHCICGGAFHGVGAKIAQDDRKYLSDAEILEQARKLNKDGPLRVFRPGRQLELFAEQG